MTYVYNFNEIMIRCGCFFGSIDEFKEQVKSTNGDSFYLDFIDLAVNKIKSMRK